MNDPLGLFEETDPLGLFEDQEPNTFLNNPVTGAAETALSIGTGSLAMPLAGLAGLATLNPDNVKKVNEALTFQPRTKTGKRYTENVGKAYEDYIRQPMIKKGTQGLEALGVPSNEAEFGSTVASDTFLNFLPIGAAVKGGKAVANLPKNIKAKRDFDSKLQELEAQKKAAQQQAEQPTIFVGKDKEASVGEMPRIESDPALTEFFKQEALKREQEAKGTVFVDNQGRASKELGTKVEDPASPEQLQQIRDMQQNVLEEQAREPATPKGETKDMFADPEQMNLPNEGFRVPRSQRGAINLNEIKAGIDFLKKGFISSRDYLNTFKGTYNPKEWATLTKSLDNPGARDTVVLMSPDQFHEMAHARVPQEVDSPGAAYRRGTIKLNLDRPKGLDDIPYLKGTIKDGNFEVSAHNGRHRMDVFKEKGLELVPVRIRNLDPDFKGWGQLDNKITNMVGQEKKTIPFPEVLTKKGQGTPEKFPDLELTPLERYVPKSQRGAVDLESILGIDKQKAEIEKISGTKLYAKEVKAEDVAAVALADGKDGSGLNNLSAGASLEAAKRRSPLIQGSARIVQRSKNIAEDRIRTTVFPAEQALRSLDKTALTNLSKVMKSEMFLGERFSAKELMDIGMTEKQVLAYNKVREMFDAAFEAQNNIRLAQGLKPINKSEAYLSSRWQGDFRRAVYDKKGNLVWYLSANTRTGVERQYNALKRDFPELSKGKHEDRVIKSGKNDVDAHQMYTTMLDVLGREDPAVAKLREWYENQVRTEGEGAYGQTKHFKEKSNVRGFVGDRPGVTASKDAVDMFQQQINYAKNAHKWSALQEAGLELKKLFSNEELQKQQPNNLQYVREYYLDNVGLSTYKAIDSIEDSLRQAGISPNLVAKGVNNVKSLWITQKLAGSLGFMASNVIQAANILPHLMDLRATYGGNPLNMFDSIANGMRDGYGMAIAHITKTQDRARATLPMGSAFIELSDKMFIAKAMKYAEDNSVTARSIYDESPIESTFSVPGRAMNIAGKTISMPETFLRSVTYMTYVHQLKGSKAFKDDLDLFRVAEEKTNISMGDYREGERALIFNKLGTTGQALNTLTTFPINYYNQWSWAARESAKGNVMPMLTMFAVQYTAAGMMGIPGFQDTDKLITWIKDQLAEHKPEWWNKVKEFDIKDLALRLGGEAALYGALSAESGVSMTSRAAAPAGSEMLAAPGAPIADLAKQAMSAGSALIDPTDPQKRAQALMDTAPVGLQGALETGPLRDQTSVQRPDGRLYSTRELSKRQGKVLRDENDEFLRSIGLRSQKEARETDIVYRTSKQIQQSEKAANSLPSRIYNEVRKGDKEKAAELMKLYVDITGKAPNKKLFDTYIQKEYLSQQEKLGLTTKSLQGLKAIRDMRELLEKFNATSE